jgi:hypothetical protein
MKLLRSLLTNGWFTFAIALYLAGLFVLSQRPEFSVNETLVELPIFGFAFRLLASELRHPVAHCPYGQVSWKQPGSGSPMALGAPGGVSWITTFTSGSVMLSFRTTCTSPAGSKKVPPVGITCCAQPSAS